MVLRLIPAVQNWLNIAKPSTNPAGQWKSIACAYALDEPDVRRSKPGCALKPSNCDRLF
jgi:hypothetical protein